MTWLGGRSGMALVDCYELHLSKIGLDILLCFMSMDFSFDLLS